jgi:hypothetical protein
MAVILEPPAPLSRPRSARCRRARPLRQVRVWDATVAVCGACELARARLVRELVGRPALGSEEG